jgi:hypothetical protein
MQLVSAVEFTQSSLRRPQQNIDGLRDRSGHPTGARLVVRSSQTPA